MYVIIFAIITASGWVPLALPAPEVAAVQLDACWEVADEIAEALVDASKEAIDVRYRCVRAA